MTIKISRLDDAGSDFDTKFIEAALAEDTLEEMSPAEREIHEFQTNGIIPDRVAKIDAVKFGLRKIAFDVWGPTRNVDSVESSTAKVWHLEKDADGNEVIVRAVE